MTLRAGCNFGHERTVSRRRGRTGAGTPATGGRAVAIPAIVLGEYRYRISESRSHIHYEQWLAAYLPSFQILNIDEQTTIFCSAVRYELRKAGTQIPSNDVWIAALCRQHSLPLVSRDRHFDAVSGITRLDW